jgi:hypothetical protein
MNEIRRRIYRGEQPAGGIALGEHGCRTDREAHDERNMFGEKRSEAHGCRH